MSEYIEVGQPLQFTDPNTPTRVGEIVESVSDIYNIPSPRLGMQVFVKSEKKSFVITSLKSKVVNGVDVPEAAVEAFEAVGAKSITWNNDTDLSNMNDFVVAGVYDIKGERTRDNDNLPILNTGVGHSFNARLTVLDSSISGSGEDDDKCITQVLSFSNRLGQGEVYIRTGKGSSLDNLTWEKWSTIQRNVNVGEVTSLDHLIDNGIYSGIWREGSFAYVSYPFTFVCVVINDYFLGGSSPRKVSQFVYGVSALDGTTQFKYRVKIGNDNWSDWEILNKNEIDSMITDAVDAATKAFNSRIDNLIDGAPETLDTLKEIADWVKTHEDLYTTLKSIAEQNSSKLSEIESLAIDGSRINSSCEDKLITIDYSTIGGGNGSVTIPAATTTTAGVMSAGDKKTLDNVANTIENAISEEAKATDEKIATEINKLENGDTIVAQAREIHSRNGKTVPDSFLIRTTAGSGTIGDGVSSLKSVGGNIVKNLHSINNADNPYSGGGTLKKENGILVLTRTNDGTMGVRFTTNYIIGHTYYCFYVVRSSIDGEIRISISNSNSIQSVSAGWNFMSHRAAYATENTSQRYLLLSSDNNIEKLVVSNCVFIDLTEMFGAGNEPDQATCDKLFGTMETLPQGLNFANPTEFKSTGFNQFNPDNVLEGKAIVDNAIVNGDKKIAVIPCLPCKVGVGENNGYCIHGDFGNDIKVYLTPLNPMEVEGELYMHELTKDATTDTYVPLIKGYMLVEVPTTANLCAHFLWSEDKCERDSYEPYFESKIELPTIPQMSEYGLAGIQSSGTLACDEIDFVKGVYRKKIGAVDLGSLNWSYAEPIKRFQSYLYSRALKDNNIIVDRYTTIPLAGSSGINKTIFTHPAIDLIYLNDNSFVDAALLKESLQGVMLYYELKTPEEYPLPKVDNNYISSDYGVEQFDSKVPCNANNLYYMRSLAGETRNFLDRLMAGLGTSDATVVADRILAVVNPAVEPANVEPEIPIEE